MRSQISTASVEGVDFVFSMDNKKWFWNRTERWFNDLNCQIDSLMALSFHYTLAANLNSWCCFRCDRKVLEFWWLLRKCLMRHFGIHSSKELSSFSCVFLNPGFFWSIFGYPKITQTFFFNPSGNIRYCWISSKSSARVFGSPWFLLSTVDRLPFCGVLNFEKPCCLGLVLGLKSHVGQNWWGQTTGSCLLLTSNNGFDGFMREIRLNWIIRLSSLQTISTR